MADVNPIQPNTTETDMETTAGLDSLMAELTPADERPRDASGKFVATKESDADPEGEEPEASVDDAAPDEDRTSDEEEQETEPDVPTIDPPSFWTAEERAAWSSLTPQAQKVVLAKETERDAYVSRVRNEAAEEKKAASQERQQLVSSLTSLNQLQAVIDPVLAEGNQTDWVKLSREDPALCQAKMLEYQQHLGVFNAVQAEIQRIQQQQAGEAKANHAKRLSEVFPEYADPEKGKALRDSYVPTLKDVGFTAEEIEQGWGIQHEPRYLKILDKAAKFDKLMAERAKIGEKKVVQQPSKVVKPRGADTGAKGKPASVVALEKRAEKTGNLRDEVDAVFANLMNGTK